jgi:hypothetical protein
MEQLHIGLVPAIGHHPVRTVTTLSRHSAASVRGDQRECRCEYTHHWP